ncbi:MAG: PAS domain-containing protein, partial [Acidobacteria bacterium]
MSDSLFDALPVALIRLDAGGRVVRLNAAAARLLRL